MIIYLARHGQDQDNANGILNGRRNTPLTDIGRQQAQVLAQTIAAADLKIQKIYSSPLLRAYVTAETVADELDLSKPEKLELLIERDFGVMSGLPTGCIADRCAPDIIQGEMITYFLSPEGAETFPDLIERGKQLLGWIEKNVQEERILLVGHGDMGKMIYAAFYGLDWKSVLTDFHFGNSEVLLLKEGTPPELRHIHRVEQYNS